MVAWTTGGGLQFFNKIFFNDEAHFTHAEYVNKKNFVFGVLRIPKLFNRGHYIQKNSQFSALFGPKVWLNLTSSKATMERLSPSIRSVMVIWYLWRIWWFQQDRATFHTTRANIALLQGTFPSRIISRRGDINWPLRSCNLKPLDFFVRLRERPCLCRYSFNS